jgi:hypothetical protein
MPVIEPRGHMGHTVRFDTAHELAIFREDVQSEHFTMRRFGRGVARLSYDTSEFDWDGAIRQLLIAKGIARESEVRGLDSLSNLHRILAEEWTTLDESELNKASTACYDTSAEFEALYRRFIKDVIAVRLGEPVWWQRTPTMRFHFPRQKGFDWRVRYHTDIMLGHPPQEINVWIALTPAYGTNSMCLSELEPSYDMLRGLDFDFEKFAEKVQYGEILAADCAKIAPSLELNYGEFVAFDPRCIHATQNNLTDHTRISIDLRVLPESERERMRIVYRGTGRRRMLFAPGHYYDERLSSEI